MDDKDDKATPIEAKFELVGEEEEAKNWKGMILSVLVILAVAGMVGAAIVLGRDVLDTTNRKELVLDDLLESFEPKTFESKSSNWISNNKFIYLSDDKNIRLFNCDGFNSTIIVSNHTIIPMVGDQFSFLMTSDPNVVLFSYDRIQVNRHSKTARYKLFNAINNMVFDVISSNSFENVPLQNALLSPSGRKLAFVDKNNIFLMEKFFDGQKDASQITTDGSEKTIYNGITDWLYEEEILLSSNAMYWSENSRYLAYIKFDDSNVQVFDMPIYDSNNYPQMGSMRYPKVGSQNPTVDIFIYDTENKKNIKQQVPNSVLEGFVDYYVWNVKFLSNYELIIVYVNRVQTKSITVVNDVSTGTVNMNKEYPSTQGIGWNTPIDLKVSTMHNAYFQIWSIDNFQNILSFNRKTGNVQQVTMHQFDVTEIVYINDNIGEVFYIGTNGDPKQRHLFRKKFTDLNSSPVCMTCKDSHKLPETYINPGNLKNQINFDNGTKCLYHSASFSTDGDFYALNCLGDRIPITYIKSIKNESINYIYEDNEKLKESVDKKILPKKSYLTVVLNEETNETVDAELYYPPEFDPNDKDTTYPVLIYTYGSPSTQVVSYKFHLRKFEAYLATNFKIIIASIDGRGSGANGEEFMKSVYQNLGKFETEDQFKLVEALKHETYTDNNKFAIWGWSYGGYLSALALLNETTPFQCCVSGAPVTAWELYDTAYTERYLGENTHDNRKSYERSSLVEVAKKNSAFFGKRSMLLVHGTGDDNVHFQNSVVLAGILRKTNIDLDFEVYPNDRHTPNEINQGVFFKKMTRFLLNCYDIDYKQHLEALNLHHLIIHPPQPPEE